MFFVERHLVGVGGTLFKKFVTPRGLTIMDDIVGEGLPCLKDEFIASQILARKAGFWRERHLPMAETETGVRRKGGCFGLHRGIREKHMSEFGTRALFDGDGIFCLRFEIALQSNAVSVPSW